MRRTIYLGLFHSSYRPSPVFLLLSELAVDSARRNPGPEWSAPASRMPTSTVRGINSHRFRQGLKATDQAVGQLSHPDLEGQFLDSAGSCVQECQAS